MYGLKAWTVIGYTADADIYCPACAALTYDRTVDGVLRTVADERPAFSALDFEGNSVHPIFASDELEGDERCTRCSEELLESDDEPAMRLDYCLTHDEEHFGRIDDNCHL